MRRNWAVPPLAAEVQKLRTLLPNDTYKAPAPHDADAADGGSSGRSLGRGERPVRVLCRFRGQSAAECQRGGREVWDLDDKVVAAADISAVGGVPMSFSYDRVFGPEATQADVYSEVEPTIREVLGGVNGAVLCYGQTSAGKTFTMEGVEVTGREEDLRGIAQRAFATMFEGAGSVDPPLRFQLSMLDIYMERLRDLLAPDSGVDLKVMEDRQCGVRVHGLQEVAVSSLGQALEVLRRGQNNRAVASTGMNDRSSRSHSIVMLQAERAAGQAKLCLVDLAGSECLKKARLKGGQSAAAANAEIVEEAKCINQSLTVLGLVVNRLADRRRGGYDPHVPYRSSKLTRVLQDTLGGNSRTVLVINCAGSSLHATETVSTLRFGARASSVVNSVLGAPVSADSLMLQTLTAARNEIERLQQALWESSQNAVARLPPSPEPQERPSPLPLSPTLRRLSLAFRDQDLETAEDSRPQSSRRPSRATSRRGRASVAASVDGSPRNLSPLDLSPQSNTDTRRLSIIGTSPQRSCRPSMAAALSPLALSEADLQCCRPQQALPTPPLQLASIPTPSRARGRSMPGRKPTSGPTVLDWGEVAAPFCSWEFPQTKRERMERMMYTSHLFIEKADEEREALEESIAANELSHSTLAARCEALQCDNDWLRAWCDEGIAECAAKVTARYDACLAKSLLQQDMALDFGVLWVTFRAWSAAAALALAEGYGAVADSQTADLKQQLERERATRDVEAKRLQTEVSDERAARAEVIAQSAELERDAACLREELDCERRARAEEVEILGSLHERLKEQQDEAVELKREVDQLRERAEQSDTRAAELGSESADLQEQLASQEAHAAQLKSEVEQLRERRGQFGSDAANLREQLASRQAEAAELREEAERLRERAEQAHAAAGELGSEVAALREQLAGHQAEAAELNEEVERLRVCSEHVDALGGEVAALRAQLDSQNAEATELKQETERLRQRAEQVNVLGGEAAALREQLANQQAEATELMQEMERLRERADQVKILGGEAAALREQLANQQAEAAEFIEEAGRLRERAVEADVFRGECATLREQLADQQAEAAVLKEETQRRLERAEQAEALGRELQDEAATLREELASQQAEAAELRTEAQQLRDLGGDLGDTAAALRDQLANQEAEAAALKAKVQQLREGAEEADARGGELQNEAVTLRGQLSTQQAEAAAFLEEAGRLWERAERADVLEREIGGEAASLREELAQRQAEAAEFKLEAQQQRERADRGDALGSELGDEAAALREHLACQQAEAAELRREAEQLRLGASQADAREAEPGSDANELREQLVSQQAEATELRGEVDRLRERAERADASGGELGSEAATLRAQLSSQQAETAGLCLEAEKLREREGELRREAASLREQLATHQVEAAELRREAEKLRGSQEEGKARDVALEGEAKKLREKLSRAQGELFVREAALRLQRERAPAVQVEAASAPQEEASEPQPLSERSPQPAPAKELPVGALPRKGARHSCPPSAVNAQAQAADFEAKLRGLEHGCMEQLRHIEASKALAEKWENQVSEANSLQTTPRQGAEGTAMPPEAIATVHAGREAIQAAQTARWEVELALAEKQRALEEVARLSAELAQSAALLKESKKAAEPTAPRRHRQRCRSSLQGFVQLAVVNLLLRCAGRVLPVEQAYGGDDLIAAAVQNWPSLAGFQQNWAPKGQATPSAAAESRAALQADGPTLVMGAAAKSSKPVPLLRQQPKGTTALSATAAPSPRATPLALSLEASQPGASASEIPAQEAAVGQPLPLLRENIADSEVGGMPGCASNASSTRATTQLLREPEAAASATQAEAASTSAPAGGGAGCDAGGDAAAGGGDAAGHSATAHPLVGVAQKPVRPPELQQEAPPPRAQGDLPAATTPAAAGPGPQEERRVARPPEPQGEASPPLAPPAEESTGDQADHLPANATGGKPLPQQKAGQGFLGVQMLVAFAISARWAR